MLDERKSEFELLEHVIKGVHVEGSGPKNHRVVVRPMEHINKALSEEHYRSRSEEPE
jgi:hypothetical protein